MWQFFQFGSVIKAPGPVEWQEFVVRIWHQWPRNGDSLTECVCGSKWGDKYTSNGASACNGIVIRSPSDPSCFVPHYFVKIHVDWDYKEFLWSTTCHWSQVLTMTAGTSKQHGYNKNDKTASVPCHQQNNETPSVRYFGFACSSHRACYTRTAFQVFNEYRTAQFIGLTYG